MGQGLTSSELNQLRGLRWSAEDARKVLASWRTSGLSVSAKRKQALLYNICEALEYALGGL